MKRIYIFTLWLLLGAAVWLWGVGAEFSTVAAQGGYDLSWWTVEGGGTSSGGAYQVTGVAGQMDAGVLSDGNYTLTGGFMAAETVELDLGDLFMPSIKGEE